MPRSDAPARPAQVVKALAMLAGNLDLWEADGKTHALCMYLAGRVPGARNPLGNLRQYRDFGDTVEDAATVLRLGWQPDDTPPAPDLVLEPLPLAPVPYPQLVEDTLAHEFTELDSYELRWALTQDGDPLP